MAILKEVKWKWREKNIYKNKENEQLGATHYSLNVILVNFIPIAIVLPIAYNRNSFFIYFLLFWVLVLSSGFIQLRCIGFLVLQVLVVVVFFLACSFLIRSQSLSIGFNCCFSFASFISSHLRLLTNLLLFFSLSLVSSYYSISFFLVFAVICQCK